MALARPCMVPRPAPGSLHAGLLLRLPVLSLSAGDHGPDHGRTGHERAVMM